MSSLQVAVQNPPSNQVHYYSCVPTKSTLVTTIKNAASLQYYWAYDADTAVPTVPGISLYLVKKKHKNIKKKCIRACPLHLSKKRKRIATHEGINRISVQGMGRPQYRVGRVRHSARGGYAAV